MDDISDANSDEKKLEETRDQVDALIGRFGFEIKCWHSNSSIIRTSDANETKVLGVKWELHEDKLFSSIGSTKPCTLTKRSMLSRIAET